MNLNRNKKKSSMFSFNIGHLYVIDLKFCSVQNISWSDNILSIKINPK